MTAPAARTPDTAHAPRHCAPPLGRLALAFAGAAVLTWAAAGTAPAQPRSAPEGDVSLHELLEQEKLVTEVWKAYFPSRELATRAAITFHANLLEAHYGQGYLVMQLDWREQEQLRRFGFRLERATEFIERRNRALTEFQIAAAQRAAGLPAPQAIPGYACYETVEETFAAADALIASQPTLARWVNAGPSWLKTQDPNAGWDLKVLKLSNSAVPAPAAGKPKLLINSAIHAREYATAPLTLAFARWLVEGYGTDADATWILDHHEVHLLLHANPDGRKRAETGLSWRKNVNNNFCANTNTRGVDLNRNFTFQWNSTNGQGSSGNACSLTYRGPFAASEPETQALEGYIRSLWPDRRGPGVNDPAPADTSGIHLDIHSFGQLVLWPWGATSNPAPNGSALATLGRRFAWFNGHQPTQSIGLYPTDGTSDGPSYGELGVAAFTFEIGTSFFQSCSVYENDIRPKNLPALVYAAKVVRTPYITPGGPDVLAPALAGAAAGSGVPAGTPVTLAATATDTRFNQTNGSEPVHPIAAAQATIGTQPWDPAATPIALQAADGSFDSATEALAGSLPTTGLPAGRHLVYVQARDTSGTWGPVTATFLTISGAPPLVVAEVEPNNVPGQAQLLASLPVQVNAASNSSVRSQRSDADWFQLTLQPSQSVQVQVQPNPALALNAAIAGPAGETLVQTQGSLGQTLLLSWGNTGIAPVTVLVRLGIAGGQAGPVTGAYTLTITP